MQSKTCLIAITTPRESEHFFSALLRLVDTNTGKPIFNVLRIGNPCDACKETETPWLCSHKMDELPPWKSMGKQNKYGEIYKGNEHLNLREQWGIEADNANLAFKKEFVERLEKRERFKDYRAPDIIFMAGDPAGGGQSAFGISAAYWDGGKMVIIYLDAAVIEAGTLIEEQERLRASVRIIRSNENFRHTPIVYIPENDPGKSTSHAPYYLRNFEDILTMRECANRKYGVPKSDVTTFDMQYIMEGMLASGDIVFSKNLMSLSHTSNEAINELIKQYKNFMWDVKSSRGDSEKVRVKLTGKKSGGQDDLLISVMMIPYWRRIFLESDFPDYHTFKKRIFDQQ